MRRFGCASAIRALVPRLCLGTHCLRGSASTPPLTDHTTPARQSLARTACPGGRVCETIDWRGHTRVLRPGLRPGETSAQGTAQRREGFALAEAEVVVGQGDTHRPVD